MELCSERCFAEASTLKKTVKARTGDLARGSNWYQVYSMRKQSQVSFWSRTQAMWVFLLELIGEDGDQMFLSKATESTQLSCLWITIGCTIDQAFNDIP